ncbi:MAG: sulfotransferase domain-containing protein, partial [Anaerolineales bacterium]|nr:sulfotransferase domain-containing protein [Anaerolineales bacterium]
KQQFLGWNTEKVAGDVSIGYFQSPEAPKRIREHLDCKHLKLIVLLREPIDRALSFYEMRVLKGNLLSSFEESLKIPYYRNLYIESGHYYRYYKNYLESFSKDQILILLQDEMKTNPDKEISKVCEFIGVRSDYNTSIPNKKANVGKSIKYPKMHYYLTYLGFIFQAAFPPLYIGSRIRDLLMKISFKVNFYNTRKDYNLDPIVRKYLEGEFRPSNERLREMSGIELGDNWKYL